MEDKNFLEEEVIRDEGLALESHEAPDEEVELVEEVEND